MRIFLLSLLTMACFSAAAQSPDLIINNVNFTSASYNKGDRISFSFTVKNIGTAAAARSHTRLYLSSSFSYTGAVTLATISCKALAANEESEEMKCAIVLPYTLTAGNKYLLLKADANNEVLESNETNDFHSAGTIAISSVNAVAQNLPFPIIFIHGFVSSNTTWDDMKANLQNNYGFSYGGNMNFCLNQDNNTATSNAATDYHDWTDMSALSAGDFYTVNFDTDPSGNTITNSTVSQNLESNQAAVVKQGLAVRDAIKHVLQITGRSKVILCGHSMGGLASREYLERSPIWQADGQHHVAKLVTLGTPHGGSNLTGAGLGSLGGLDEYSEAVRDLRTSYFWSGAPGVYLFGGQEKYSVMQFYPFFDYVNVDVNCNGFDADNSMITGLNQKSLPSDIAYTCSIGNASGTGDYVVSIASANLNNYLSVNADTFMVDAIHTSLTSQASVNIKALDETKDAATAYNIIPDNYYSGFFTQQSIMAATAIDHDYYRISMPQAGNIRTELFNIPVKDLTLKIYDASYALKYSSAVSGNGYADILSGHLPAGNYILDLGGQPETGSDATAYTFRVGLVQVVAVSLLDFNAAPAAGRTAFISWKTANGSGSENYELQRSANAADWTTITTVNTQNNTGNYSFIDDKPLAENYYRLKIKEANSSHYSSIKKVSFIDPTPLISISPNPAKGSAVIKLTEPVQNATVFIYDMQGRQWMKEQMSGNELKLNLQNLPAGTYAVKFLIGENVSVKKLLVTN